MTNILDKEYFNLTFLWVFRGLIIQRIKTEHCFDSEGSNIKDGVQNGRQLSSEDLFDQHTQ